MNDQQHKQPWRKSNQLTIEDKDSVSAIALNRKAARLINNIENGESLRNANQRNEFISDSEDDQLMQTWRKRADEFFSKCSRRPQPRLLEGRQEQRWIKDRVDRSANIYHKNNYLSERDTG